MARPTVAPRDLARKFEFNEFFFSTTDHKGIIQSGNEVFARVSGYDSVNEMIGQPHNIIRHPDMPRAVFKLMWSLLRAGDPFAGYVKNLATDGCYYWVMALVVPVANGYLSVRFKPSSPYFAMIKNVYNEMLALERETGEGPDGKQSAIDNATKALNAALAQNGFPAYADFMRIALAKEMECRRTQLGASNEVYAAGGNNKDAREVRAILHSCVTTERLLYEIFEHASNFLVDVEQFDSKAGFLREMAHKFHLVSLNGIVSSAHLDSQGAALSVITQNLAEIAQRSKNVIDEMISQGTITSLFRTTSFTITAANVQVETAIFFAHELLQVFAKEDDADAGRENQNSPEDLASPERGKHGLDIVRLRNDLDTLVQSFAQNIALMLTTLPKAQISIVLREDLIAKLTKILQTLSMSSVAGKVQAVQSPGTEGFLEFFDEVNGQIRLAKHKLNELDDCIPRLQSHLPYFEQAGSNAEKALRAF